MTLAQEGCQDFTLDHLTFFTPVTKYLNTAGGTRCDDAPRHDYGWIGLLGLLGLSGLIRRSDTANCTTAESRNIDSRRAA